MTKENRESYNTDFDKWIIAQYQKGLESAKNYYIKEDKLINESYFSVDFSELFIYMYNYKNSRYDSRLIEYLFRPGLNRNFKYVILPPAMFELQKHYESLRKNNYKYSLFTKPDKNVIKLFEKIEKIDDLSDVPDDEIETIMAKYRKTINKILRFDSITMMGTRYGKDDHFKSGHERLVNLIEKDVLLHPTQVGFLKNIGQVSSDIDIYNNIYEELKSIRSRSSKYSNSVDAEHAALILKINNEFTNDNEILNIFTGSPIPLDVYERFNISIKREGLKLLLAKCSVHVAARQFCENELEKAKIDKMDFLNSGIHVLNDMMLTEFKIEGLSKMQLYEKSVYYTYFWDTFMRNENFGKYLYEALKFGGRYESFRSGKSDSKKEKSVKEYQHEANIKKLEPIKKMSDEIDVFLNKEMLVSNLDKTQDILYKNSLTNYRALIKKLKKVDSALLSPMMQNVYIDLLNEPLSPEELRASLKRSINE
jgi:hypothetical protein